MLCVSTALTAGANAITPRRPAHATRTGARHSRTPSRASAPRDPWRRQLGQGPAEKAWCPRNLVLILMLMLSTRATSMREHTPKRAAARAHGTAHDARVRATPMAAAAGRATRNGDTTPIAQKCSCSVRFGRGADQLTFCSAPRVNTTCAHTTACRFCAHMCIWTGPSAPAAAAADAAANKTSLQRGASSLQRGGRQRPTTARHLPRPDQAHNPGTASHGNRHPGR